MGRFKDQLLFVGYVLIIMFVMAVLAFWATAAPAPRPKHVVAPEIGPGAWAVRLTYYTYSPCIPGTGMDKEAPEKVSLHTDYVYFLQKDGRYLCEVTPLCNYIGKWKWDKKKRLLEIIEWKLPGYPGDYCAHTEERPMVSKYQLQDRKLVGKYLTYQQQDVEFKYLGR